MTISQKPNGHVNGHKSVEEVTETGQNTSVSITKERVQEVHKNLMDTLWELWKQQLAAHKPLEQGVYSRIVVLSSTQLAAVLAVDVGLTESQFLAICHENFKESLRRAPKWG
jgi:hypothetical protein